MKNYAYTTNIVEWAEIEPMSPSRLTDSYRIKPGRFMKIRKRLVGILCIQWWPKHYTLRSVTIQREKLGRLISEVMNRSHMRCEMIEHVIVSRSTAFEIEEELFSNAMTFNVPMCNGGLDVVVYGIPVVVIPGYEGDEIIIVPKEEFR